MKKEEQRKKLGLLIAKVWADENFKAMLKDDPLKVLKDEGVEVLEGVKINVVENTDKEQYLVIPEKPEELSEEILDNVVGGIHGGCGIQTPFHTQCA